MEDKNFLNKETKKSLSDVINKDLHHMVNDKNNVLTPAQKIINKQPVVEQLRAIDREELLDLVKMHLSFLIDVTTDEWERIISAYKPADDFDGVSAFKSQSGTPSSSKLLSSSDVLAKSRSMFKTSSKDSSGHHHNDGSKHGKDSKSQRSRKELASNIFGAPLSHESLAQISLLIDFLNKPENYCVEGIFRKSGNSARQQELRYLLNCGVRVDLEANRFTALDVSCVLKAYIQELTEPLLTENHFEYHYELAAVYKETNASIEDMERRAAKRLKIVQLLLFLIPDLNRQFFQSLMALLHLVSSEKEITKMDERSLATIFGSHILCPRNLTPKQITDKVETITDAMEFMLLNYKDLFTGPTELKLDARNKLNKLRENARYQQEQNHILQQHNSNDYTPLKYLSTTPKSGMGSGLKSSSNPTETLENDTIITFCHANQSNTEEALAELYAQVQAMPETPHKRRLIKQFNKQNGFGTPKIVVQSSVDNDEHKSKWKSLLGWKSSSKQKPFINP